MHDAPHPGKDRTSGHFGFCGHSDPVEFRNIEIKRLDAQAVPTRRFQALVAAVDSARKVVRLRHKPTGFEVDAAWDEKTRWEAALPADLKPGLNCPEVVYRQEPGGNRLGGSVRRRICATSCRSRAGPPARRRPGWRRK